MGLKIQTLSIDVIPLIAAREAIDSFAAVHSHFNEEDANLLKPKLAEL